LPDISEGAKITDVKYPYDGGNVPPGPRHPASGLKTKVTDEATDKVAKVEITAEDGTVVPAYLYFKLGGGGGGSGEKSLKLFKINSDSKTIGDRTLNVTAEPKDPFRENDPTTWGKAEIIGGDGKYVQGVTKADFVLISPADFPKIEVEDNEDGTYIAAVIAENNDFAVYTISFTGGGGGGAEDVDAKTVSRFNLIALLADGNVDAELVPSDFEENNDGNMRLTDPAARKALAGLSDELAELDMGFDSIIRLPVKTGEVTQAGNVAIFLYEVKGSELNAAEYKESWALFKVTGTYEDSYEPARDIVVAPNLVTQDKEWGIALKKISKFDHTKATYLDPSSAKFDNDGVYYIVCAIRDSETPTDGRTFDLNKAPKLILDPFVLVSFTTGAGNPGKPTGGGSSGGGGCDAGLGALALMAVAGSAIALRRKK
jgi:hypothetical protein